MFRIWLVFHEISNLCLASTMRGRAVLRVLVCLCLTLLLYNVFVVQFRIRPQSSSGLLPRPNARFAPANPSSTYPSPIQTFTSPVSIISPQNLPAVVAASPVPASHPTGTQLAARTDPPTSDPKCNHVRNPSFENRYAAICCLFICLLPL